MPKIPQIGETITSEEFNRLPNVGETISPEQFAQLPNRKTFTETELQDIERGKQAERFLGQSPQRQVFSGGFGKEFVKETAKTIFKTPIKTAISLAEVPETAIRLGGKPKFTQAITGQIPIKSFQEEARERAGQIIEGEKPLISALKPFAEVPLAVAETVGLGKLATKGISTFAQHRATKQFEEVAKAVTPIGKKEVTKVLSKGKFGEKGLFGKKVVYIPDKKIQEIAQTVQPFYQKNKPIKTIQNLNQEITRISENEITPFLKANNKIYNNAQLKAHLDKLEPPLLVKDSKLLSRNFETVKNFAINELSKGKHTRYDLWRSLSKLDDKMESEFGEALWNPTHRSHQAVRSGYLGLRRAVHGFIVKETPEGGKIFTEGMKKLHNLYEGKQIIAEKNYKVVKNIIQPIKKAAFIKRIGKGAFRTAVGGATAIGVYEGAKRLFSNR